MIDLLKKDDEKKEIIKFKLPINYVKNKYKIQESIKSDLELIDISGESLYNNLLTCEQNILNNANKPNNSNNANKLINNWNEYYTDDKNFLRDSQFLLKKYKQCKEYEENKNNIDECENIMNELKNETGFLEKYKYIDNPYIKELNKIPSVLQVLTVYNLSSPVLSLLFPIVMLIFPFLILKIQKVPINVQTYLSILKKLFKNHALGQIFNQFSDVGWDRRVIMLFSVGFYLFNIYQNFICCFKFYKNLFKIQKNLNCIKNFIGNSIKSIDNLSLYCRKSYKKFIDNNQIVKAHLSKYYNELCTLKLDQKMNLSHLNKIGGMLKSFYDLYDNYKIKDSINYCLDLQFYLNNIENLQNNIKSGKLNFCSFSKNKTTFKGGYFASLINSDIIKNDYSLDKQILITGPNAAGKTTLLKTTLFNIITSQQMGIGCYESASINLYKYIHSYINIPDTSQRDSLFQAEARRCKEILDSLSESKNTSRHFCIFDEIYSGTNPSEAIASAYSFLNYISKFDNLDYILTTHYNSLCNLLSKNNRVSNMNMEVLNEIKTYKLKNGISNIKGGIKVLEDLKYNSDIIDNAKDILNTINI
tara:strand:- start:452 stop:2215 length:1764 start_codon:yes stop_codon:yes gene_type:complete